MCSSEGTRSASEKNSSILDFGNSCRTKCKYLYFFLKKSCMNTWETIIFLFHVLAEVGQNKMSKAKISWVNNVNKEVFVPPDLHGIVEHQEEEQQKTNLR